MRPDEGLGENSRERKELMDPATENGVINWLIWVVFGVTSALFTLWNATFNRRIKGVEEKTDHNNEGVHKVQLEIKDRFAEHERDERIRDEEHSKEVRKEFKDLNDKVESGHREILTEIHLLKRSVNGGK